MLTAYGKKLRDYFLKIEELITFKLRASILEVTNEFKKHTTIINEIEKATYSGNLTDSEIATKHLIFIENYCNTFLDIMKNLPIWEDLAKK